MALASTVMVRLKKSDPLRHLILCSGFDEGSPDGHDPLQIAREMAGRGITLVWIVERRYLDLDAYISLTVLCGLRACIERLSGSLDWFHMPTNCSMPLSMLRTFTKP